MTDSTVTTNSPTTMQHQPFFRKWGGLVVLSLALAIIIIDTTLLNVSLKTIIIDLHTDLKSMQWVITIYSLILAAFTITGGRLGDLFGRKKMFLLGAVIFAIGSFIASISTNVGMMIAGEAIIEGFGAAMMMPATASLLITNFKGRDRSIAFGVWGGIAAASSAIGPILGGFLTTNYSWRWGFRINIVVVALVLLGAFLIHETKYLREKSKIDFLGIVLSAIGLLSIVFGFIQASSYGWWKVKEQLVVLHHTISFGSLSATPVFILLGIVVLTLFMIWERFYEKRGHTPLLSLHLFQNSQFVSGASTMAVLALGQAGLFFTVPVFLQAVRHLDALHTGLTMLPMSIALLVAAPLSSFLVKFIRPKLLIQIGMGMSLIAFLVLRATLSTSATAWSFAPAFLIFGFGMGLIMAQVSNLTLSAVDHKDAGEASGVNNTLRMTGQTLGSAILGAILLSSLITNVSDSVRDSANIPESYKTAIERGLDSKVSDISFGVSSDASSSAIPASIKQELEEITQRATVKANKKVMIYGMIFIFLGLLVSTRLPNLKDFHSNADDLPNEDENEEDKKDTDKKVEKEDNKDEKVPKNLPVQTMPANSITESEPRKNLWKWVFGAGAVVVVLAALGVYANQKSKNNNDNTNKPVEVVVTDRPQENTNANSNTTDNSNTNTQPQTDVQVRELPQVPSAPNYSNAAEHFAFNMPITWKVVKDSDGEVVFKGENGMYNVQSYPSPDGDWGTLKSFLEQQPGISNIRRVMWGSRDLFQFDSSSSYLTGYAFLENGRLYYVLGTNSENTPLVDLKTF